MARFLPSPPPRKSGKPNGERQIAAMNSMVRSTGPSMNLTERFRRLDADTLLYQFTVDDLETFTQPWSVEIPVIRTPGPIFEYACHEGNYALRNVLAGARAQENAAAQTKKDRK